MTRRHYIFIGRSSRCARRSALASDLGKGSTYFGCHLLWLWVLLSLSVQVDVYRTYDQCHQCCVSVSGRNIHAYVGIYIFYCRCRGGLVYSLRLLLCSSHFEDDQSGRHSQCEKSLVETEQHSLMVILCECNGSYDSSPILYRTV